MILKSVLVLISVFINVSSSFLPDNSYDKKDICVCLSYKYTKIYTPKEKQHIEPILLLHGLASSKSEWDNIFDVLASQTGRKVYAFDLRNHGDSCWSNDTYVDAMARDVKRFLNSQGIRKVSVIGHSLGGKVAVHFTLNHPERVDSIIVEDMRANGITPEALYLIQLLFKLEGDAVDSIPEGSTKEEALVYVLNYINDQLEKMGVNQTITYSMVQQLQISCSDGKCGWTLNFDAIKAIANNPEKSLTHSEGLYEGPACFIYGTASPFKVGEDEDNIRELFPAVEFFPVEGAGHDIHGVNTTIFLEDVFKCLKNVP